MTQGARYGKAMLLVNVRKSVSRQEFKAFFLNVDCNSAVDRENFSAAKCVLMDPSEIAGLPHQRLMAHSPPPFDAAYQLRSSHADSLAALADGIQEVVEQLSAWINRTTSAVLVGTEIAITQGSGPIEIIMPLRRQRELSPDDFMHNWFIQHAALSDDVQGVRYRQSHVDIDATNRLAQAVGIGLGDIDGVTEAFFLSSEEALMVMSQPQVANEAIEDEKRFIDHGRSQFGFYRVAH